MIILFPTALYESVLPKKPSDVGNVSFSVSSFDPPRGVSYARELFRGEEVKPLPDRVFPYSVRRMSFGDLVFSVSVPSVRVVADGKRAYEVGQLLDFGGESQVSVGVSNFPQSVELQQNTNELDYASAGLSDGDVDRLVSEGSERYDELVLLYQNKIADQRRVDIDIQGSQKTLNEVRKLIDATRVALGDSGGDILDKLIVKESGLISNIDSLMVVRDNLGVEIEGIYGSIIDLREVVR